MRGNPEQNIVNGYRLWEKKTLCEGRVKSTDKWTNKNLFRRLLQLIKWVDDRSGQWGVVWWSNS